jgi:hypothetical protein
MSRMHKSNKTAIIQQMIKEFYPYSKAELGFKKGVSVDLLEDLPNAKNPLGKTAYYDPEKYSISIYITGRHPKDVLRSLSHELVHHSQNCRGEFNQNIEVDEGYAQKDEHLREMERQAYEQGNLIFRDWEDHRKINNIKYTKNKQSNESKSKQMSKEKEKTVADHYKKRNEKVNKHLMEKWGFKPKEESKKKEEGTKKEND